MANFLEGLVNRLRNGNGAPYRSQPLKVDVGLELERLERQFPNPEEYQSFLRAVRTQADKILSQETALPDRNIVSSLPAVNSVSFSSVNDCIPMPLAGTYALGLNALRKKCLEEGNPVHPQYILPGGGKVYRPLTVKEIALARLHQFHTLKNPDGSNRTLDERIKILSYYLDSCCGIAYPRKERNLDTIKLIPVCEQLITLPPKFNQQFCEIDYDAVSGIELSRSQVKFNSFLSLLDVDEHRGWLTLFEGDSAQLRSYWEMIQEAYLLRYGTNLNRLMTFWLSNFSFKKDQLGAVVVDNLDNFSDANGRDILNVNGRFLLCSPVVGRP